MRQNSKQLEESKKRLAVDYKSGGDSIDPDQLANYLLHMQAHGGNVETLSKSVRKDAFVAEGLVIWCQDGVLARRAVQILDRARTKASQSIASEVWDQVKESVPAEDRLGIADMLASGTYRDIRDAVNALQDYAKKSGKPGVYQAADGARALLDSPPDNVYVAYYDESGALQWQVTTEAPL